MGFFKKFFLGCFALGFILVGGSGTQSSNMLLQGGGFIGLIIGLIALYIFTKMAWRAMGCLPSFIVIMGIVCFVIYAIGGFNNGLGGVIENLQSFMGMRSTIQSAQVQTEAETNKEEDSHSNPALSLGENFSDSKTHSQEEQSAHQNTQESNNHSGILDFVNNLTGKQQKQSTPPNIEDLPGFTSVVNVLTGDTLDAQGHRIKLYGVASPDIAQTCADKRGASYNCGQQAALWLRSWLLNNPVSCKVMKQNAQGNMLCVCALGQYDLGAALVNAGWAIADTRETDIYLPYEENAHANNYGLWQGKFYKPWDWQALKKRKPKIKIIQPQSKRRSFFKR